MQVTKELIESDIANLNVELERAKASVANILGALAALNGVRDFLDKPDEVKAGENLEELKAEAEEAS